MSLYSVLIVPSENGWLLVGDGTVVMVLGRNWWRHVGVGPRERTRFHPNPLGTDLLLNLTPWRRDRQLGERELQFLRLTPNIRLLPSLHRLHPPCSFCEKLSEATYGLIWTVQLLGPYSWDIVFPPNWAERLIRFGLRLRKVCPLNKPPWRAASPCSGEYTQHWYLCCRENLEKPKRRPGRPALGHQAPSPIRLILVKIRLINQIPNRCLQVPSLDFPLEWKHRSNRENVFYVKVTFYNWTSVVDGDPE